jgi:serine/threonine protein kinase
VYYRDLNGRNILIDGETGKRCVLIDFGHARILKRRRGMSDDEEELLLISLEDGRSANEYFMSRRIHELTGETKRYQSSIDERQGLEREFSEAQSEAQRIDLTSDIARTDASISGSLAKLNHHRLHHHYIDDAESALYVWLYEASFCEELFGLTPTLHVSRPTRCCRNERGTRPSCGYLR